jgi:GNAT superfamily N-acetyltransferase
VTVTAKHMDVVADRECTVRFAGVAEGETALSILLEAAAWGAARGTDIWSEGELRAIDFAAAARTRELVIGHEGAAPAATMLLQTSDPIYWPDDAPGDALYVHKVGVRRAFASRGWLTRLIAFAAAEARARSIDRLRLDTILRPRLRSMYERHGFITVVEEPLLRNGRQMIRMERAS